MSNGIYLFIFWCTIHQTLTQNGERSDTEHNDRRKHDYKSNRENKKSDGNNKEKKKSKQDNFPTDINNKKTFTSWVIV